jgi:hypothetical protein
MGLTFDSSSGRQTRRPSPNKRERAFSFTRCQATPRVTDCTDSHRIFPSNSWQAPAVDFFDGPALVRLSRRNRPTSRSSVSIFPLGAAHLQQQRSCAHQSLPAKPSGAAYPKSPCQAESQSVSKSGRRASTPRRPWQSTPQWAGNNIPGHPLIETPPMCPCA